ncbi:MAG: ATP-binding protein [Pseudomonadota bacterium]
MLRNILSGGIALALVAMLVFLVLQSRTVNEDYYLSHAARNNLLLNADADRTAVTQGLQSAYEDGRTVATPVQSALGRLLEGQLALEQSLTALTLENDAIAAGSADYAAALTEFAGASRAFMAHQEQLTDALATLQYESPTVVKTLRRFKRDAEAQNVFSLTLDVIDYAASNSRVRESDLRQRVRAFREDTDLDAEMAGRMDAFLQAASTVVQQRALASSALDAVNETATAAASRNLLNSLQASNRLTVGRAERARLLLAMLSVFLLGGVAMVGLRLRQSYRALNDSNDALERVNSSLEERVRDRTAELSEAFSELKESQVQLVQAEKMSSLGSLVAGISHEINTPLWYLISNASTIQERLGAVKALSSVSKEMLEKVRSGENAREALSQGLKALDKMYADGLDDDIEEAGDLIEDCIGGLNDLTEMAQSLKDFSRLDRAPVGDFDVNDGLDKTLLIAKNKLKEKVTVSKDYGEVPTVRCSPSQINQIFLNLITNAADAIETSGEITVRTRLEDDKVLISIADTGSGIPEDILSKIHDPFFTTKEVGSGTGLGLSIVDRIIKAHNGALEVESTPGEGTTFTVALPIDAAGAVVAEDTVNENLDGGAASEQAENFDPVATVVLESPPNSALADTTPNLAAPAA